MVEISLDAVQKARQRRSWFNVLIVLAASLIGVEPGGLVGGAAHQRADRRGWARRSTGSAPARKRSVAIEGTVEVRRLQHGFNQAARALAESRRLLQSRIDHATAELASKNRQLEVASQAKTRLLAAASHDLRQPLHALTLFSDGLANGETDPVRLQRIGHIRECVESLDRLFSELLNLSQLDAGVLQPQWSDFPLDALFDEISRNFRTGGRAAEPAPGGAQDRAVGALRLRDAVAHPQQPGVQLAAPHRAKAACWSARGGAASGVRIDVVDTGVGIAREHQARVFEEFYQVDPTTGSQRRRARAAWAWAWPPCSGWRRLLRHAGRAAARVPGRGTCVQRRWCARRPRRRRPARAAPAASRPRCRPKPTCAACACW